MSLDYEKQVGKRIRKIRLNNKYTQEQLAAKLQVLGCDITRSALAKIESGQRHIYIEEIKALTKALNVRYEDLIL